MTKTIRHVAPSALHVYENNPRTHSRKQINLLIDSITEFGFVKPIVVDEDFMILAGHGVHQASIDMELDKVPITVVDNLTEQQKRAYIIADNRLSELSQWDKQLVALELKDLATFDFDTLQPADLFEKTSDLNGNSVAGGDRNLLQLEFKTEGELQSMFAEMSGRDVSCKILT